ncbi:MAG: NAD+ synthase [Candidatus Omnitrophota bacterium]
MKSFHINPKVVANKLTDFISKSVKNKGFRKVVLGLSGGLDSTAVAYLSKRALGPSNVIGILMPYGKLSSASVKDAKRVAMRLKIMTNNIDISDSIDAYFKKEKSADCIRRGNKMARERMSILYDMSKKYNALVIGTSNKTEALLGYGTIHGDCAWAMNPIGALYKTQLKDLSRHLGVPSDIINKAPSAGLWDGQTDEDELGYRYEDIDRLLFFMVDKRLSDTALANKGFGRKFIIDIRKKISANRFKSEAPLVAKL